MRERTAWLLAALAFVAGVAYCRTEIIIRKPVGPYDIHGPERRR